MTDRSEVKRPCSSSSSRCAASLGRSWGIGGGRGAGAAAPVMVASVGCVGSVASVASVGCGASSVTIGLRSQCSPARGGSARCCAASDCRVVSSRVSQASMPTCSLRIRMPPEECPMVQRTVPPSTSASRVSSPSVMRTDLISSDLRKRPARSTVIRSPSTSESCATSSLSMMRRSVLLDASCETAMLRSKAAPDAPAPSTDPPGEPAGSIDIGRIVPPPSAGGPAVHSRGVVLRSCPAALSCRPVLRPPPGRPCGRSRRIRRQAGRGSQITTGMSRPAFFWYPS